MPSRIQKNSRWLIPAVAACLVTLAALFPHSAQAYFFQQPDIYNPATDRVCTIDNSTDTAHYNPNKTATDPYGITDSGSNRIQYGFAKRIVICMKETILFALNSFIVPFVAFLGTTITAACVLAVMMWGILMVTGRQTAPVRDMFLVAVKIGAVIYFTSDVSFWFSQILDAVEYMLGVVAGYTSYSLALSCPVVLPSSFMVWDQVDCLLDLLIGGIFSDFTLSAGLLGFAIAALGSNSVGMFIGLICLILIAQLLFSIARCVYIFITSYMALGLMFMASPLFIPLILFRSTKAYFEKWLKVTLGFMLQPIVLFAYMGMMIAAFDTVLYSGPLSLYRAIAGSVVDGDIPQYSWENITCIPDSYLYDPSVPRFGDWIVTTGAYGTRTIGSVAVGVDWKEVSQGLGIKNVDTGLVGSVGTQMSENINWNNPSGVLSMPPFNMTHFPVDMQVTVVDLQWLACNAGFDQLAFDDDGDPIMTLDPITFLPVQDHEGDIETYLARLILASIMAVITTFIFLTLLDSLPFIGAGLSGDPLSMPAFGTGSLSMPGTDSMTGVKKSFADSVFRK